MSATRTAFAALVRKDLVTFLRDRRALLVSVLTPIAVAAFFGFLFGGNRGGDAISQLPVAIVDQDGTELSKAIGADLAADPALAALLTTEADAHDKVRSGKLRAAIVIPAGFGAAATAALFGGADKPAVRLFYDPSQSLVRPILEGLLVQNVMRELTRDLTFAGGSIAVAPGHRGAGLTVPFALAAVAVSSGPAYNSYAHSFAGMSVQFVLFMGIDAGVNLLLMRQQGFWRRLRAAPLSRGVLLGGRATGTSLIALLILAAVYAAAILVFGVRIAGSVAGFIAIAVAFAMLAATMGIMIAALGRSVGATRGIAIFVVLLLVMLGGAWVPAFLFPAWLQQVSAFLPTRWAVDGFDAVSWRGLPFGAAVAPVAVLCGWTTLFALIAAWRFDWDAD
jgi:ABC-2 type transport system permease protein